MFERLDRRCGVLAAVFMLVLVMDILTLLYAVLKGPFPLAVPLGSPTAYLNLYVHVPLAMSSYLVFAIALIGAILYLIRRRAEYDRLAMYAVIVGEVYGFFTVTTGMAWARESWGAAWNWDPRETGVLLLILAYMGYFALRSSIPDPERMRAVSNAYAIAAFAMVPISFASPYLFSSLHPSLQQAQEFMWTGNTAVIMASRIAFGIATATSLVLAPYKISLHECAWKPIVLAAVIFLAVAGATALYLSMPYVVGETYRVLDAGIAEYDKISWILLSNGSSITFNPPIESPVKPALTVQGSPSIVSHIVSLSQEELSVVRHWCVSLNVFMYGLAVAGAVLVLKRTTKT